MQATGQSEDIAFPLYQAALAPPRRRLAPLTRCRLASQALLNTIYLELIHCR